VFTTTTDTLLRASTRIAPIRRAVLTKVSPEASAIMEVGDAHSWPFRVLGRAPLALVDRPVYTGDWWVMKASDDTSALPAHAMERVQAIFHAGARPKDFVIAHEVPKLLKDPSTGTAPVLPWWRTELRKLMARPLLAMAVGGAIVVVAPLILGLLIKLLLGAALVLGATFGILGLGAVAVADPVLVAVTQDDVWIEIDRWA